MGGPGRLVGVLRGTTLSLLIVLVVLASACEKKAPPAIDGAVKPGGIFADVIAAIDQIKAAYPKEMKPDGDVGRSEWKLIESARKQFLVPPVVSETSSDEGYYMAEETGGGDQGDALDVILDAEWDEYKNLSASVSSDEPSPELREEVTSSLKDLYRDLPTLMEATPDSLRERVIHIVTLRYYNTILRAGADPSRIIGSAGR